jgi:hypothetical protein
VRTIAHVVATLARSVTACPLAAESSLLAGLGSDLSEESVVRLAPVAEIAATLPEAFSEG